MNPDLKPDLRNFDYLKSINAETIEDYYTKYVENPDSVDPSWRYFFDGVHLGEVTGVVESQDGASSEHALKLYKLALAYRQYGHRIANLNPLFSGPSMIPELDPATYGLSAEEIADASGFIAHLKKVYASSIGVELLQIQNLEERAFIEQKIEALEGNYTVAPEDKKFILKRLTDSETLERFIHTRYVAQKRFSIEGGEALIPGLDAVIETAANLGAEEVVLGMAHRGRLNVLVNTMKKNPEMLFTEFDDNYPPNTDHGEGDVKYHKGASYDHTTRQGKKVHLSLGFNPSHLEFINPVVVGMARAKQNQRKDDRREKVLSIVIHGDAAFAGQGVVYETLQSSQLEGYNVGGTVHIVSNNQVGFTTDTQDARSTQYCTDLARMLNAPIFHVNGDDPEALWITLQIATEFRYRFKKDVFIDLICYRKYGHNEGDEPSFTQPAMYKAIAAHPSPRDVYGRRLVAEGIVDEATVKSLIDQVQEPLQKALDKIRAEKPEPIYSEYEGPYWSKYHHPRDEEIFAPVATGVDANTLVTLSDKINHFPQGFKIHSKLERIFEARHQALVQGRGIDWGNAEVLAYASLVNEGSSVRLTGQDVKRGTFTHRHAAVFDFNTNEQHIGINTLSQKARLSIHNSHLSETGVMGMEYGYSVSDPDSLVIWEAQFGDFANGAQVIIDQFISTSETKWHRVSGLTLLLPHGYEGQGPEHSSARLERFLQLCGRNNMTVAYPSTPAQIFHALRRQVKRKFRKPLIVMTPKSLLRHPRAISTIDELSKGVFNEVIDDFAFPDLKSAATVKRLVLCTGKLYYDLLDEREKQGLKDIALVRVEQFYPFPEAMLAKIIEKYQNAKDLIWAQEEPRNMGAWPFINGMWNGTLSEFGARFPKLKLSYRGREIGASPAVGSKKLHDKQQAELIAKALKG